MFITLFITLFSDCGRPVSMLVVLFCLQTPVNCTATFINKPFHLLWNNIFHIFHCYFNSHYGRVSCRGLLMLCNCCTASIFLSKGPLYHDVDYIDDT